MLGNLNEMMQQSGCTITQDERTAHQRKFSGSCKMEGMVMESHSTTDIPDPTHIHTSGKMHMVMKGRVEDTSTETDERFISSDCGAVKPGEAVAAP